MADAMGSDPGLDSVPTALLGEVLRRADRPGDAASCLTENLRACTGARCVLCIQCLDETTAGGHRVLGVSPQQSRAWAESPGAQHLYVVTHRLTGAYTWLPGESSEMSAWLGQEAYGLSTAVPLQVGAIHAGAVILLGLADTQHVATGQAILRDLSTVMALIVRNATLFEQQEHAIQVRTAEMRRASDEFHDLYNRAPCGYHSLDAEGVVVQINDTELEWLGYTREEIVGVVRATDLFAPKSQEVFRGSFPLFKARGGVKDLDMEMLCKDGTILHVLVNATAIYDHGGNFVRSLTTVHDITDRKRAEEALRRTNRELAAISKCNEVLMRANDEQELLQDICRIVCQDAGYCMAWVGYAEDDERKSVTPVASAGIDDGYVEAARVTWADSERGRGAVGMAIRSGQSFCVQDIATDSRVALWRAGALARGYRSVIGLPLTDPSGTAFGALVIYSTEPDSFTSEEVRLLEGLAKDLAFGIGVLRDRAERKQSEAALAAVNTEWSAAMDASADVVYLLGLDRHLQRANQAFFSLIRATPEAAIGTHIAALMHPDGEVLPCAVCRAQDEKRDLHVIMEAEHPDNGTGKPIEITCRIVRNKEGVPLSILVSLHDLSHDRELQEVLKSSEERYRLLFEHSPTAKWEEDFSEVKRLMDDLRKKGVTDLAAHFDQYPEIVVQCAERVRIRDVNQAALAMHGAASKEDIIAGLLRTFTPESFAAFRDQLVCLWNGETSSTRDGVVRTLAGEPRHVTVYFSVCPGYESTLSKVLVSLVDITERRRAELEREKLQAQLLQSQKMESLGSLAGGVAHDMNNVLGAILGLASVHANQAPEGSRLRRGMETIISACQRGGTLVKGLLGFARQELAEEQVLDLNALVREVVSLLERTTLQKVRLETDLQWPLRPVKGDHSALSHALMNLCVNAVDAMPEGGVLTLRTRNEPSCVLLEVGDTGEGMTPEVLERALDPFFTTKPQGKGTGLGLPLVYGTVKAHHGGLEIVSQAGGGTTVRVTLPSCEPDAKDAETEVSSMDAGRVLHILVVDDDELLQETLSDLLDALGHRASLASSGEEAIQKLESGLQVDAVILDVNMPGMGGVRALPAIRALSPDAPVLLATGRADQSTVDVVRTTQRVSILPKPFSLGQLGSSLDALFPPIP